MIKSILFVGTFPNPVDKYKGVFFQNLVFAMADKGVKCVVINPLSITHYKNRTKEIPNRMIYRTPQNNSVEVYYPKFISYSSRKIGPINTGKMTEAAIQASALKAAKRLINNGYQFDCVYGHFFLNGGLAACKIGKKHGLPGFVAFGECDYESQVRDFYGELNKKDIEGLSGVICVSTNNFNCLMKKNIFCKIPMIVAPNSVDHTLFKKMDKLSCRKELGLPEKAFIVSFVGGLIERKGDKRLLAAINMTEDVYVIFAGVAMHGEELPAGEKVLMCKPFEHDQIPVFLNASDVFCLPTLSEGSCNAVVEAMSCGLPVISSDLPFNDDALHEDNSIRVDPMSIDQIRDAIQSLKDNENERTRMGDKAFEDSKNFDIIGRASRILSFMNETIETNND